MSTPLTRRSRNSTDPAQFTQTRASTKRGVDVAGTLNKAGGRRGREPAGVGPCGAPLVIVVDADSTHGSDPTQPLHTRHSWRSKSDCCPISATGTTDGWRRRRLSGGHEFSQTEATRQRATRVRAVPKGGKVYGSNSKNQQLEFRVVSSSVEMQDSITSS